MANISCNNGDIIIVSPWNGDYNGSSGMQVSAFSVKENADIPTFFNMTQFYNSSWEDIHDDIAYINYNAGRDSGDQLDSILTKIEENSYFIFGNLTDGGLLVYNTIYNGQTEIGYAFCQGVFQNVNTGKYRWVFPNWTGYDHILDHGDEDLLTECCILLPYNGSMDDSLVLLFNNRIENNKPVSTCHAFINPQIDPIRGVISVTDSTLGSASFSTVLTNQFWKGKKVNFNPMCWPVTYAENLRGYKWTHIENLSSEWTGGGTWYGGENNLNYDPNADAGTNTVGGDHGTLDNHSDPIDFTDESQFAIDGINSGFITIFNPTQSQVSDFNDFLFTGITESISTVLKRLISSPLDYVVSLSMVHYTPSHLSEAAEDIKFCGLDSGVDAKRVTKQMQIIDCGSVIVNERLGSALDYGGYAKIKLYVPYCGIFPLSTDDIIGATLHGKFIIDQLTGNCIFQLKSTREKRTTGDIDDLNSVLYEFTGNCFNSLPISATDWRGLFQGACQIASGAAAMSTGNAVAGVSSIANGVMAMKPDVIKSGNLATTYGYMGKQKPYLIFEWPVQSIPSEFGSYKGYPANILRPLSEVKGYTEVDESTFWSMRIHGTEDEMNEIKDLMNTGVYL